MPPRYELKYWAREDQLRPFWAGLRGLLELDPHTSPERPSYTISSLYQDTRNLDMFYEKVEGLKKRAKIRIRRYDACRSGFIELKGRHKRRILKSRVALDEEALEQVARGDLAPLHRLRDTNLAARTILTEYELRRELLPAVITRYDREARLLRDDPGVRITVDRRLSAWGKDLVETFLSTDVARTPLLPMLGPAPTGLAILEVKCSGPVPPVVASALRSAGLIRKSISKYCYAILRCSPAITDSSRRAVSPLFPQVLCHA